MKTTSHRLALFGFVMAILVAASVEAASITGTIQNLTHGSYFTPLVITAHDESLDLFEPGQSASEQLRAMAEGGDISGLSSLVGGADDDTVEDPAAGLLAPGQTANFSLNTDISGHTHLSLTAMILPTNDGFVGLDSLSIPETPGTYSFYLNAYDAGTEANDELITGGGAPGVAGIPAAPGNDNGTGGTGVTTEEANTTVHIHRGILGDADPSAGPSDLDSSIHRWLNPVAKLVIVIE